MLNTHLFERKYHEINPLSHGALPILQTS